MTLLARGKRAPRRALSSTVLAAVFLAGALAQGPAPRSAAQGARRVVVAGSGDVLAHIRVVQAARVHGWDRVLSGLGRLIRDNDIAFANLETPLSEERPVVSGSPPILGAPSELAQALANAGIDVLSVANNHAWDQWARGAARTLDAVRSAGIAAVGAGPTLEAAFAAHVVERGGLRVAWLALTERVNSGPGSAHPEALVARWDDDERVARAVAAAREQADVVVVSVHWSHDFVVRPNGRQRRRAAFLVEHGADLILGHGPHVLQAVERLASPRGEALCAYSLGNLVSNQGLRYRLGRRAASGAHPATWLPTTRDGAWLRALVEVDDTGRVRIRSVEAVPLFTYNNFWNVERGIDREPDIRIQSLLELTDENLRAERAQAIASALGPLVTLVDS